MTKGSTVYVVDYDRSARTGLARLLRVAGYDVRPFESGTAFLAEAPPVRNACLVLDARMPGLSGVDLVAEMKALGVTLPLIVVTADGNGEARQQARDMGASAFFHKPVDGTALLDAIDWALGEMKSQQQ